MGFRMIHTWFRFWLGSVPLECNFHHDAMFHEHVEYYHYNTCVPHVSVYTSVLFMFGCTFMLYLSLHNRFGESSTCHVFTFHILIHAKRPCHYMWTLGGWGVVTCESDLGCVNEGIKILEEKRKVKLIVIIPNFENENWIWK